jgi:hypothetical protein
MRPRNQLRAVATTVILAAVSSPAASASAIGDGGGGIPPTSRRAVGTSSHHPGSADWELIAVAGAGTVALVAAGLTPRQRGPHRRRVPHPDARTQRTA